VLTYFPYLELLRPSPPSLLHRCKSFRLQQIGVEPFFCDSAGSCPHQDVVRFFFDGCAPRKPGRHNSDPNQQRLLCVHFSSPSFRFADVPHRRRLLAGALSCDPVPVAQLWYRLNPRKGPRLNPPPPFEHPDRPVLPFTTFSIVFGKHDHHPSKQLPMDFRYPASSRILSVFPHHDPDDEEPRQQLW